MIIDTHAHPIWPLKHIQGYEGIPQDFVNTMVKYGIYGAFFISWSPRDILPWLLTSGTSPEAVSEMNRRNALGAMRQFPDHFYWFPCHINPSERNYLTITRENLELGAAGIKIAPSYWGELPDDPRLLPLYDLVEEYGAQVIIDTSYWYLGKDKTNDHPQLLATREFQKVAQRIENYQDYLSHLRPIIESHTKVNFQLAHAGARKKFNPENMHEVGKFIHEYPNIFADLGALITKLDLPQYPAALKTLIETAGEDRIMFGTDWPHFARREQMGKAINNIKNNDNLSLDARRMILGENALRFVGGVKPGLREYRRK